MNIKTSLDHKWTQSRTISLLFLQRHTDKTKEIIGNPSGLLRSDRIYYTQQQGGIAHDSSRVRPKREVLARTTGLDPSSCPAGFPG